MKRVLLTGMSGTGKSAVIRELAALGHAAVDLDADGWSTWVDAEGDPTGARPGKDWAWREDRVRDLLTGDGAGVLFVAGCAPNMGAFLGHFDHVVLLTAPVEVMLARLAARTDNPYGKRPEEVARVLANLREIEPRLRAVAGHEVATDGPLAEVVTRVLRCAGERPPSPGAPMPNMRVNPSDVSLREITEDTVIPVVKLSVAESQKGFVAPNAVSLAQALFAKTAWYRAIYLGAEPVGFVMLHDESLLDPPEPDPEIGVWRFMVDERFQGRGIGGEALRQVIALVRARGGFRALELSYVPGPGCAEPFYRALGFQPTGRMNDDEVVLELLLDEVAEDV